MFNYTSPINDKKEYSDLIMSEIEPIAKINLRGKKRDFLTKIGKSLSIIPKSSSFLINLFLYCFLLMDFTAHNNA